MSIIKQLLVTIKENIQEKAITKLEVRNHDTVFVSIANGELWNECNPQSKRVQDLDLTLRKCGHNILLEAKFENEHRLAFALQIFKFVHNDQLNVEIHELRKSKIESLTIAGPNLHVERNISAQNLHLSSTLGELQLNAHICTNELHLEAEQNIARINTESLIDSSLVKITATEVYLNGKIYAENLEAEIISDHLYIGVDGVLGGKKKKLSVEVHCKVSGTIINYGEIVASTLIELDAEGLVSNCFNKQDTAQRCYEAAKDILGVHNEGKVGEASVEALSKAIKDGDTEMVATLLELGIDPNETSEQLTSPVSTAKSALNDRKDKQSIKAAELLKILKWQRGKIEAKKIRVNVKNNFEDCAQIKGEEVDLTVGELAICEEKSIWSSTSIKNFKVDGDFIVNGQIKIRDAMIFVQGALLINNEGAFGVEDFVQVEANSLKCVENSYWAVGESMQLKIRENLDFMADSFIQASYILGRVGNISTISGHCVFDKMDFSSACQIIIEAQGQIDFIEGNVLTKDFTNNGFINSHGNFQLTTEQFKQGTDAWIKVEETFTMNACEAKNDEWTGVIEAKNLYILTIWTLICDGNINASNATITLFSKDKSHFYMNGNMQVEEAPLIVNYGPKNDVNGKEKNLIVGLIFGGKLYAEALYANEVNVEFLQHANIFLNNNHISSEAKSAIMIQCLRLNTYSESFVFFGSDDDIPQLIFCNEFIHEGELVESSSIINFVVQNFVNKGIIHHGSFEDNILAMFPCVDKANFYVQDKFENFNELVAMSFKIHGKGNLQNHGVLKGLDLIDIRLNNIDNGRGIIAAPNIHLRYLTERQTSLSGHLFGYSSLVVLAPDTECLTFDFKTYGMDSFILAEEINFISAKNIKFASQVKFGSEEKKFDKNYYIE